MTKAGLPPPGFLVGLAASVIAALWSVPDLPEVEMGIARPEVRPAAAAEASDLLPPMATVEEAMAAVAARPLLAENRQRPEQFQVEEAPAPEPVPEPAPAVIEPPVAEVPEPSLPDVPVIEVAGVMIAEQKPRILFRNPASGEENWLMVGDQIEGWTLVEITQVAAVLEAQGMQITIPVYKDTLP